MTKTDTRPPVEVMVEFINDHLGEHGVEPICKVLLIDRSTYYDHLAKRAGCQIGPRAPPA
ncbi:hypothetical protein HGG73_16550 [Rhodobacteraceae bacterium R_SAG3]|uniref:hypothetical protein n=1 Tax=Tritonibacter mobilis TaxID=379347 RepID=UPI0012FF5FA4|nr:hypothetical protein [Tritonibacter mobilis]NKX75758.1 hypothetical protein [Rhodobacteraceae bacterium R_SAG3]